MTLLSPEGSTDHSLDHADAVYDPFTPEGCIDHSLNHVHPVKDLFTPEGCTDHSLDHVDAIVPHAASEAVDVYNALAGGLVQQVVKGDERPGPTHPGTETQQCHVQFDLNKQALAL